MSKERVLDFKYFKGPISHTLLYPGYEPELEICSYCKKESIYILEGLDGCVDCLKARKFSISKDTEAGEITNGKIVRKGYEVVNEENLLEICYTPDVSVFQNIDHPVHCKDFMVYIGRWEQEDFHQNTNDGDGEKLWMKMVDQDMDHLWEETEKAKAKYGAEWPQYENSNWAFGSCVYVFECLHCKKKRCHWDCG